MTEATIVEQLRLQEGRLFQNERTLALYLDLKAVVTEALVNALSKKGPNGEGLHALADLPDADLDRLLDLLQSLAPQGVSDYHSKSLHECVKDVAKLLWPSQMLLVARPRLSIMIGGMLKRLAVNSASKAYLELDPIKQDFVIREAFRRCLINDCLIVFDSADGEASPEDSSSESEVGPDDSASRMGPAPAAKKSASKSDSRPLGARSALGPVDASYNNQDDSASCAPSRVESVRGSTMGPVAAGGGNPGSSVVDDLAARGTEMRIPGPASVMGSGMGPTDRSDDRSVAPKVVTVQERDAASTLSRRSAGGSVTSSVVRRPMNVRKIHIDTVPEE